MLCMRPAPLATGICSIEAPPDLAYVCEDRYARTPAQTHTHTQTFECPEFTRCFTLPTGLNVHVHDDPQVAGRCPCHGRLLSVFLVGNIHGTQEA